MLVVFLSAIFGCSSVTPLENFQNNLHANVGKKWEPYPASWHTPSALVDTISLLNGNTEHKYRYRLCIYVLIVDSKTKLIVGTRIEGKEADCYLPP